MTTEAQHHREEGKSRPLSQGHRVQPQNQTQRLGNPCSRQGDAREAIHRASLQWVAPPPASAKPTLGGQTASVSSTQRSEAGCLWQAGLRKTRHQHCCLRVQSSSRFLGVGLCQHLLRPRKRTLTSSYSKTTQGHWAAHSALNATSHPGLSANGLANATAKQRGVGVSPAYQEQDTPPVRDGVHTYNACPTRSPDAGLQTGPLSSCDQQTYVPTLNLPETEPCRKSTSRRGLTSFCPLPPVPV